MEIKLWEERRFYVANFLEKFNIRSIADFGCGEGKLITYLIKFFENNKSFNLNFILGMDIQIHECENLFFNLEKIIKQSRQNLLSKTNFISLKHCKKRKPRISNYPNVHVVCHDLLLENIQIKNCFNLNTIECIILIEVIEHLHWENLDKFFQIILEFFNTQYIIVTTPNKEYNVLYALKEDQLRHWDHKFEFTRSQFLNLCDKKANLFGYSVIYEGIGEFNQEYGHPTQVAIFNRINKLLKNNVFEISESNKNENYKFDDFFNKLFLMNSLIYKRESKIIRLKKFLTFLIQKITEKLQKIEEDENQRDFFINDLFKLYNVKKSFKNEKELKIFLKNYNKFLYKSGILLNFKSNRFKLFK
jgi:hypothetical protein